jgi:hypothetical protein
MLLSFAQFEREIAGERIRDKIAASKRKGMWMGGNVPLGYDVKDRKLTVNEPEASTVRAPGPVRGIIGPAHLASSGLISSLWCGLQLIFPQKVGTALTLARDRRDSPHDPV